MRWDRSVITAAIPAAVVAVIAGLVSYSHIVTLSLTSGQSPADAHLLPFAVDGLIVAGTVILLAGSLLGWLCVAPGITATLYANVMSGVAHGTVSATVAAWPAVAFALASFTLERWLKSRSRHAPAIAAGPVAEVAEIQPPAAVCGHEPVGDAERDVQLGYLHARDCIGEPASIRQLSAASGLSRYKVEQLVTPLNGHKTLEGVS